MYDRHTFDLYVIHTFKYTLFKLYHNNLLNHEITTSTHGANPSEDTR